MVLPIIPHFLYLANKGVIFFDNAYEGRSFLAFVCWGVRRMQAKILRTVRVGKYHRVSAVIYSGRGP